MPKSETNPELSDHIRYDVLRSDVRSTIDEEIVRSGLPGPIQEAIRYGSTEPQASRWRALLVLEVGRTLGVQSQSLLGAAASVEALHCATLCIDDLPSMDDALNRRGLLAMHRRFNEAMAIQASLWLLGASRTLLANAAAAAGIPAETIAGLSALQQRTENELQLGQFMDLMGSLGKTEVDFERVARLKCGRMFALAAQVPAWLCAPGKNTTDFARALNEFGEELGLAYQIRDDLQDAEEDDTSPNWSFTECSGRPTFVAKHGRSQADSRVGQCLGNAIASLAPLGAAGIDCRPIKQIARVIFQREL